MTYVRVENKVLDFIFWAPSACLIFYGDGDGTEMHLCPLAHMKSQVSVLGTGNILQLLSNANSQGFNKSAQTLCVVLENMDCICQCGSIQMSVKGLSFPFLFPFYTDTRYGQLSIGRWGLAGLYLGRRGDMGPQEQINIYGPNLLG